MKHTEPRQIRTGGDPRPFSDFTELHNEMSKLIHPARPDIHWARVEQLSLALFEKNGIELQTGAWYTLARSHLARVGGMHEGLNILAAMLSHQWTQFWPQASHPRAEILCGLFQRLQKVFRTFSLSHEDYPQLQQLEATLDALSGILARQALQQVCQIAPLLQQVRSAVARVENTTEPQAATPGMTLPVEPQLLYVIQPEPSTHVAVAHEKALAPKRAAVFLCGMLTAFVLSAVGFAGWHALIRPDALSTLPYEQALSGTPDESLTGWHQGMLALQHLSEQLNALDGQKGRYLTVSELKSQVFAATLAFNKTVPVEEQLRLMSGQQAPGAILEAQKLQAKQHLQQLITRYFALTRGVTLPQQQSAAASHRAVSSG